MRSVSLRLVDLERKPLIPLGFEGENEYMTINFDCKTVFDKHPAAVPTLAVTPPQGDSYPAVVVRDGDIVSWTVCDSDLVYPGEGELQLTFVDGTIIGKTYKARTKVLDSITPSGEAPTPIQNWLIQAAAALQALPTEVASSVAALMGAMVGVGETLDPDDDVTVNYDPVNNTLTIGVPHGRDGEDGHTPAITANKVGKVATFYVDGVAIVQISDGQDADPTVLIDDTSTAQNRTWSAKKLGEEKQSLKTEINSKQDAPASGASAGKVLGLGSNLAPVWMSQSGGSSDYTDLSNKPQINSVALEGNKTPSQLGLLSGTDVSEAVDTWLETNITNPDSPPLDRSLTSSSAATPADITGGITSKLEKVDVEGSANKWNKDAASVGLLHTNGQVYTGGSHDNKMYGVHIPVEQGDVVRVFYNISGTISLGTLVRVASYDSNGTIVPESGKSDVETYTVPSGIASIIITITGYYNNTAMVIINDATVPSAYIPYKKGYSYYKATDDFIPGYKDVKEALDIKTLPSKNLNTGKYESRTHHDVTFTVNDDGSISLSGTADGAAFLYSGENPGNRFELPPGAYTLSGGHSNNIYIYLNFYDDQTTTTESINAVNSGANPASFTTTSKYYCTINVYVADGENTNGIKLYPQLEVGGEATEYVSPAEYDDSERIKNIEEDVAELQREVTGADLNVPDYYNTDSYLANKCKRFNLLARQSSGASDSFAFVTDIHWTQNAKKSPALLRFIRKNTRIEKLFCGGDICDFEQVENRPYDAFSNFVKAWEYPVYTAVGNHEYLSQYGTEGRVYYSFNSTGKDRIGNLDRSYFYIDNPQPKIRYIFLSAYKENNGIPGTGYEQEQLTWLQNEALDLESGWGAIVVTHMTHDADENSSFWKPQSAVNMLNILDAYNGDGEIICVISGHTHADYYDTTTGGIPIIVTTCDKYMPWISGGTDMEPWLSDRVAGTITEQAIDLYLIDRTAKTISKVRVGCPIHYGTDPETWTEYEDVTISYSRE